MVSARQRSHHAKVVVIGAGFAGLGAATTLIKNGLGMGDVVVLEAGDSPGGRARTQPIDSSMAVEMGATWLHGLGTPKEMNPIFRAALEGGVMKPDPVGEFQCGGIYQEGVSLMARPPFSH